MVTDIQSTDLDFNEIKESLKTYFESKDEFADYNFEGAALSNILDVLAWNTHFNALTANMAINESFLETAQLRSAVVTHAQSLGYFPKSKTSAQATVNISVNLSSYVGTRPDTVTLPTGTKFNATVDGVTYVFQTRAPFTATDNGFGQYIFQDENGSVNLKIYEGTEVTKTFLVASRNTQPIYVIPDPDLDTETVVVRVFENRSTTSFVNYSDIKNAIRITTNSRFYLLREAPNQHFELQFGPEESFGTSPSAGNKIEVNYLRVNGADANGARSFIPQESFVVDNQSFALNVSVVETASSGSGRETLEQIRFNAPLGYASQRRMVTKQDYEALITSNYSTISSVSAWGGEENDPVDYGKIYLSPIYTDENLDSDSKLQIQDDIRTNLIEPLATMSIDPVFVDVEILYLALICRFDYNPNKSELTAQSTKTVIRNKIEEYFEENLKSFGGIFRKSNLLADIDDINEAILSTRLDVKMVIQFEPTLSVSKKYNISFPQQIADPDNDDYIITSTLFTVNNRNVRIRNKLGSRTLQLVNETGEEIISSNIGSYTGSSGVVTIDDLNVQSVLGGNTNIKIIAVPGNQGTIRPIRNFIIDLDDDLTSIIPTVDYQNTRTTI